MKRLATISRLSVLLAAICLALAASAGVAHADTIVTASAGTRWVVGTTYDLATGDTLPGIDVALWSASEEGSITAICAEATTTTDPDGDYALPIAAQGTYVVRFTDPLGLRQQLNGLGIAVSQPATTSAELMVSADRGSGTSGTGSDPGSGDIDPSDDTTITGQDAYLGLPWALAPTVVDGVTGDPLPGITIRIAPYGTSEFLPDGATDASGTFSVSGLPVGGYYWAYLVDPSGQRPAQYAFDEMDSATGFEYPVLSGSATSSPEIAMHEPGSLEGHVTLYEDGMAVSDAAIELWRNDSATGWAQVDSAVADEDGYYAFSDLKPGHYRVAASDPLGELPKAWSDGDNGSGATTSADGSGSGDVFVGDQTTATADVELGAPVYDGGTGGDPNDPTPGASGAGKSAQAPQWWFLPLRPKAPNSIRYRRAFSLSGSFHAKTRHRGWIRVECSRFERGHWAVRKTLTAKTHRQLNYVGYYAKLKLPKTGRWRIRVRWTTATSGNVWSKFRYMNVTR